MQQTQRLPATRLPQRMPQAPQRIEPVLGTNAARHLVPGACAALLVTAIVLALWTLSSRSDQRRLAGVEAELAELDDEQVANRLAEICGTHDDVGGLLSRLLASPRESLAQAAGAELQSRIVAWESHTDQTAATHAADLCDALGAELSSYGPSSRDVARAIAARLLSLAQGSSRDDRRLTDACDALLRRTTPRSAVEIAQSTPRIVDPGATGAPWVVDEAPLVTPARPDPSQPWSELLTLPGGGLLPGKLEVPSTPAVESELAESESASVPLPLPRSATSGTETRAEPEAPRRWDPPSANEIRLVEPGANRRDAAESAPKWRPALPEQTAAANADNPSRAESVVAPTSAMAPAWSKLDDAALLDALRGNDATAREDIETELDRRGFLPSHLVLARGLTSPDVVTRLMWTEQVAVEPGIEPGPWLEWLMTDPAPSVRKAAIELIATSPSAPLARLSELASDDPDPGVRQSASDALKRRRESSAERR